MLVERRSRVQHALLCRKVHAYLHPTQFAVAVCNGETTPGHHVGIRCLRMQPLCEQLAASCMAQAHVDVCYNCSLHAEGQ
jgi:hypothetical protein